MVKVANFRGVLLQSEASKRYGNIGFDKSCSFKDHQALEMLDKEHYVSIINVYAYRHYLALFIRFIKMRFEKAKIYLISLFDDF